jgi:hypothetical protein
MVQCAAIAKMSSRDKGSKSKDEGIDCRRRMSEATGNDGEAEDFCLPAGHPNGWPARIIARILLHIVILRKLTSTAQFMDRCQAHVKRHKLLRLPTTQTLSAHLFSCCYAASAAYIASAIVNDPSQRPNVKY